MLRPVALAQPANLTAPPALYQMRAGQSKRASQLPPDTVPSPRKLNQWKGMGKTTYF